MNIFIIFCIIASLALESEMAVTKCKEGIGGAAKSKACTGNSCKWTKASGDGAEWNGKGCDEEKTAKCTPPVLTQMKAGECFCIKDDCDCNEKLCAGSFKPDLSLWVFIVCLIAAKML